MQIGFFDSGIGGLTVLHEALRRIDGADYIYYDDTRNVPYGDKPKEQVRACVFAAADNLVRRGAEVLVVACNTATSVAVEDLRRTYALPIIGMEPAVKPAVENHKDKRILVTATQLALREDKLKRLITRLDAEDIVDLLPLQELVGFAENLVFDEQTIRTYLHDKLAPYELSQYKAVVLGCTHFIYYKSLVQQFVGGDIDVLDGNAGTVAKLEATIRAHGFKGGGAGEITYIQSGEDVTDPVSLDKYARLLRQLDERAMD